MNAIAHCLNAVRESSGSVLLLGAESEQLSAAISKDSPRRAPTLECIRQPLSLTELAARPLHRHALAIVADPLPAAMAHDHDAVLARLRDVLAERVLVMAPQQAALTTRLTALGYRMLVRTSQTLVASFDLYDYKQRPTWLNAEHWANPQQWDRFRW